MPEHARRGDGDDAVVIPIGTGGRPGRGSGKARPSAAARNLAPSSRKAGSTKPAAPAAGKKKARAGDGRATASTDTTASTGTSDDGVPPPAGAGSTTAADAGDAAPPPPTTGIPVGDWLAAARDAAEEVFGADWEHRLAELMAFVRRRLEGDYEVDDYGFDRELTERFFMAALRPVAEKWFRLEVRGLENIPAEGGALVVSNHSGTVPIDGLMTMLTVHDHAGRFLRPLGADLVFKLPLFSALARKGGATLACTE
ncbi:MAG TPA: 1-acyl-sn-glycerol-3-phosphate acyltransferase, partial [Nocardioides sp.]|nr:1-acyl-sn-glycerol-3-phosphate acyltransferase [Nocardioides sp.]